MNRTYYEQIAKKIKSDTRKTNIVSSLCIVIGIIVPIICFAFTDNNIASILATIISILCACLGIVDLCMSNTSNEKTIGKMFSSNPKIESSIIKEIDNRQGGDVVITKNNIEIKVANTKKTNLEPGMAIEYVNITMYLGMSNDKKYFGFVNEVLI